MNDFRILYNQVYQLLNKVTPLNTDCGRECRKACCQGEETDFGMYLFPGEEIMQSESDFLYLKPVTINGNQVLLAICNGECDRNKRPLACRIFPLTPYFTKKGILTIIIDPGAFQVCPLAREMGRNDLNPDFVKKVRQVCQLLIKNERIKNFIEEQSRLLDELKDMLS